ncbi:hypothetical protein PIROE2DRAFT_12465, partial [Piromyces sp. E2]
MSGKEALSTLTLSTKDILDGDNFKVWKQQLYLLLKRLELLGYIKNKKLEKVDGSNLSEDEKKDLILVDETIDTYYKKMIQEDTKAKE